MTSTLKIRCSNTHSTLVVPLGCTLHEVYAIAGIQMEYGPVAAMVNNKVQGLNYRLYNNKDVEFLDLRSQAGHSTYVRTLFLVLAKAVEDLYPQGQLFISAALMGGYYCELRAGHPVGQEDIAHIRERMQTIIDSDVRIHRGQCPVEEAIELFREKGMASKVKLLGTQDSLYADYYSLDTTIDYLYGCLLTHTAQLYLFDVVGFYNGLLLRVPDRKNPTCLEAMEEQSAVVDVIREHHRWQEILGVRTVGEFNALVRDGHCGNIINVSEALQDKKLTNIADSIASRHSRLVLIAGPSSSGKTTTSKRLDILLMACGLRTFTISTDDYFVNRVDTPLDEHGEYDFECIQAVDTDFFNLQMDALLRGEEVELPRYDFQTGQRVFEGRKLRIGPDDVIILEGNHALNPLLTRQIPDSKKYRIYVAPFTSIQLDDHNIIPERDIRLLRRIVRDYRYRGFTALQTIRRCPSVTAGEEKWIVPFQVNADVIFNSALLYELAVIKDQALAILEHVSEREPEYAEASRLRKFLHSFCSIPADQVPPTSLLREFAGGSSFKY